jgi:hypothetical protein
MDVLPLGIVAEALMIAGQTEHIGDVKRSCAQNIALQGNAVAVPGDHLQDRLQAHEL